MYNVSQAYKDKIKENNRLVELIIRIEHSKGTLVLGDKEVGIGSLNVIDGCQAGEEFTIGGTVATHIEFTLTNKEKYNDIDFIGAKVYPTIRVLLKESVDAHFLQPSQPSKMKDFDEEWENIPMGVFNIDIANRNRTTINIKAIDNMIYLDKPYSLSKLSYPATLYQIYVDICNVADVRVNTLNFLNQNHVVKNRPSGDLSLRNVLGFVAELSGSFSKFNRYGGLELKWYTNTEVVITSDERSQLKMGDIEIGITGVAFEVDEDNVYVTGTDDYAIDLTGNELLQSDYETVLPNILAKIKDVKFIPYTSNWIGNPAMDSGDIITHIDIDGNIYKSIITNSTYKYRGTSKLDAKGLPNISRGFKSTDNRIASIIKKIEKDIGDKLTTLEQEQLNATELLANMLGGYRTSITSETDPNYDKFKMGEFIHDSKKLENSTKIWKWGLGGFGYSDDGGLTYKTGITAEGSIVAELVSAGIVTADMIQTGILASKDNNLTFNLDTGTFAFNKGIVQFTPEGLRIGHVGTNQYSEFNFNGVKRQWEHGESEYLCDIWIHQGLYTGWQPTEPSKLRIDLPARFKGREGRVKIEIIPTNIPYRGLARYQETLINIDTVMEVEGVIITDQEAYVYVSVYSEQEHRLDSGGTRRYYRGIDFDLLVVGY